MCNIACIHQSKEDDKYKLILVQCAKEIKHNSSSMKGRHLITPREHQPDSPKALIVLRKYGSTK